MKVYPIIVFLFIFIFIVFIVAFTPASSQVVTLNNGAGGGVPLTLESSGRSIGGNDACGESILGGWETKDAVV